MEKDLINRDPGKFKVMVIQADGKIHQAELWIKKRFFVQYWSFHSDLLAPVKKIDAEAEKCKSKLASLKVERVNKLKEVITLICTFGKDVYEPGGFSLKGLTSKTNSFEDKGDEAKTRTVSVGLTQPPQPASNQNKGKSNNQGNQGNQGNNRN